VLRVVSQHIADECERIRIMVDTVPRADHKGISGSPGDAHARREILFADLITAIGGDFPYAADLHLVRVEEVSLHSSGFSRPHREVIPTEAIRQRELTRGLPLVLRIEAEFPL